MRKKPSNLFAPYKELGVVCSELPPVFCEFSALKKNILTLCAPVDNNVIWYNALKLRAKSAANSTPLPCKISCIVADDKRLAVYAAAGRFVYYLPMCNGVKFSFHVEEKVKQMLLIGDDLVVVDENNGLRVFDVSSKLQQQKLHIQGSQDFIVTYLAHPSTYLNKIVLGSSDGRLRIVNFSSGKVIYEFKSIADAAITYIEQSPALDVLALGLKNGKVLIHNIRTDEQICAFKHDRPISAIGFRNDGEPILVTADIDGNIAVWDLERQEIVGRISKVHTNSISVIHFLPEQPVMITASADNSIRMWILDGLDGMPRLHNLLEGHSKPATSVCFTNKKEVVSSSLDGCVRKHDVLISSMRQKLGTAATISKAKAKKNKIKFDDFQLPPVVDVAFGWSREAAWDNMLCRHENTLLVTTWTTRCNRKGTFNLLHSRFKTDSVFLGATATSICLSPCGNFAFIGYSTGHIDQFNVQSGRFIRSFVEQQTVSNTKVKQEEGVAAIEDKTEEKATTAHTSPITALLVDSRGHELVSGSVNGELKFWNLRSGRRVATMKTKTQIVRAVHCPVSSLIAVTCRGGANDSVAVIDTLCRRVVRTFDKVGKRVNCSTFSSDGRWLLTADSNGYIRVWELSTSQLIDIFVTDRPCIGLSFNATGEYLASVHENEKAVHIWINKVLFAVRVPIKALPLDYLPQIDYSEVHVERVIIGDDEDDDEEEEVQVEDSDKMDVDLSSKNQNVLTYSGLPPSRWANLSEIAIIKERNKPIEPVKKPKQAPFFLTAAATLEGFEFESSGPTEDEDRKTLQAKRSLLEIESSFSAELRKASAAEQLLAAFEKLKNMSVSSIDFQIKSLPESTLCNFFKMLLEVLRTKRDFDLVQAYMATVIKAHRSSLWHGGDDELTATLEQLSLEQDAQWDEFHDVLVDNGAVIQWVKNALL